MNRFFFALSAALMISGPAFARSEPAHFKGALLNGDTPVRLTNAAVYFQEGGPVETPIEQLTREQLQAEYQRLEAERPGLGGAIALTAVGGGLLVIGFVVLVYDALFYLYIGGGSSVITLAAYVFLVFSAAMIITGGVLLTVGLVKLFQRISERRAYSQRIDDINARLESLDRTGAPPAPPPPNLPPPPPPPPGAQLFFDVQPTAVLATF